MLAWAPSTGVPLTTKRSWRDLLTPEAPFNSILDDGTGQSIGSSVSRSKPTCYACCAQRGSNHNAHADVRRQRTGPAGRLQWTWSASRPSGQRLTLAGRYVEKTWPGGASSAAPSCQERDVGAVRESPAEVQLNEFRVVVETGNSSTPALAIFGTHPPRCRMAAHAARRTHPALGLRGMGM